MTDDLLARMRDVIQEDPGNRGLRADPAANLVTACAADFAAACRSLAATPRPALGIVTGFFIPHADPPAAETDGPLGALFLARALVPLGVRVSLFTDESCRAALAAGLAACGLDAAVPLVTLPPDGIPTAGLAGLTHLLALERVGPGHTPETLRASPGATPEAVELFRREVPPAHHGRCHNMRGHDITAWTSPAHLLFEDRAPGVTTLGIGDGGNEIGMGKVPWDVVRRNIPRGGLVACRVPADHLIVCGVSNWGAYGLAAGVRALRGHPHEPDLFDAGREHELLRLMVERGPLVDGVRGRAVASVDGLDFERYAGPLRRLEQIGRESGRSAR